MCLPIGPRQGARSIASPRSFHTHTLGDSESGVRTPVALLVREIQHHKVYLTMPRESDLHTSSSRHPYMCAPPQKIMALHAPPCARCSMPKHALVAFFIYILHHRSSTRTSGAASPVVYAPATGVSTATMQGPPAKQLRQCRSSRSLTSPITAVPAATAFSRSSARQPYSEGMRDAPRYLLFRVALRSTTLLVAPSLLTCDGRICEHFS